jgi:hypothetical protein
LRAPRRRGRGDTPQDKPVRSKGAEAAAAGTGPGPDVESPEQVDEETQQAAAESEEASVEATSEEAVEGADTGVPHDASAGGVPEGNLPEKKE